MMARAPFAAVRFRAGGTSPSAAGGAEGFTAYTLKFSLPPWSCTKRMYLLSRLQKNPGIGRWASAVMRLALSNGSAVFFTQMFRVPFQGLRNAMNRPSGDSVALLISGFPKNSCRSMSGG